MKKYLKRGITFPNLNFRGIKFPPPLSSALLKNIYPWWDTTITTEGGGGPGIININKTPGQSGP